MKEVSKEQAKIIEKMVLDKKTNKEIAEATGLKYWEVRDYVQYVGLAGIREQMSGRKPGRRKKDGYNKEKNGPNADRHLCKTCIYRGRALMEYKLDELTKRVDKHNNTIERTYHLEEQMAIQEEKMKVANHRISDLEEKVN